MYVSATRLSGNYTCSNNYLHSRRVPVFKGTPVYLPLAEDSIVNYNMLSNGSYLDIHDDLFAPQNKEIRSHNLSFLDLIVKSKDKLRFINYYKKLTKFPDLEAVSENIEREFVRSAETTAFKFNDYRYSIVAAGYDGTCSVGRRMAFPGSDLDKAFIILLGDLSKSIDEGVDDQIVNNFKNRLWFETDQRILSYNHDTSFPTIMTVNQIKEYIKKLNHITAKLGFDHAKMASNIQNEYLDLMKASEFNIIVSQELPKRYYDDPVNALNKENVKNFAYFIESVRDGKIVMADTGFEMLKNEIQNSDFYRFSNVAQMQAMRKAVDEGREKKTKILLRKTLAQDFASWPISKQFEFVKTLIKYSCEDQDAFGEYFANDRNMKETYKPLLGLLCYGDENRRLNPEFSIRPDKVDVFLSKNEPTSLYRGAFPNLLWIDSTKKSIIEDILLQVDKLRKIELFKWINKAQAPVNSLSDIPQNFGLIRYCTRNGLRIIERTLR